MEGKKEKKRKCLLTFFTADMCHTAGDSQAFFLSGSFATYTMT